LYLKALIKVQQDIKGKIAKTNGKVTKKHWLNILKYCLLRETTRTNEKATKRMIKNHNINKLGEKEKNA
jgi:hypothetical protein